MERLRCPRHPIQRRLIYLDEDAWLALLYDGWDGEGRLRHFAHALPFVVPELPGVISTSDAVHDFAKDRYAMHFLINDMGLQYQVRARWPDDHFTPAALVGEGVR